MQKLFRWASKWWPGLIPLAVMWGFAAWNNTLPVEADLSARSSAALKDTVLDKIPITDTKVTLSGMARDLGGREAVAAALKNLPEGFSIAANDVKAPPYVFQAYKDPVAATVTLTGYVPDNNVHAAIATSASRKF